MTKKTRLIVAGSTVAVVLAGCLLVNCTSDMRREAAYRSAAKKIQRDDMRFFDDKKWVRIDYETDSDRIALDLVRCVDVNDQLAFPVMLANYPNYSGFLGGVGSTPGFDKILDGLHLDKRISDEKRFPLKEQFPLDPGIRKHVLFLKERGGGKGEVPGTEWAYFEVAEPLGESIQLPHVTKLPLAKDNKSYLAFISKAREAERALDAVRPDR